MCDFREPNSFVNLKIGNDIIEQPEFWGSIWISNCSQSGFLPGLYQIACTGIFYAYTDGFNWFSIDQNMEGHLIGNS